MEYTPGEEVKLTVFSMEPLVLLEEDLLNSSMVKLVVLLGEGLLNLAGEGSYRLDGELAPLELVDRQVSLSNE